MLFRSDRRQAAAAAAKAVGYSAIALGAADASARRIVAHDAALRLGRDGSAASANLFHSRCYNCGPAASLRECVALCGDGAAPVSPPRPRRTPSCGSSREMVDSSSRSGSAVPQRRRRAQQRDGGRADRVRLRWCRRTVGALRHSPVHGDGPSCDARASRFATAACAGRRTTLIVADVARLEASSTEFVSFRRHPQAAGTMYAIAAAVSVLPAFLFLCWVLFARCRVSTRRGAGDPRGLGANHLFAHANNETMRVLDVARRAFASRWRSGWPPFSSAGRSSCYFAPPISGPSRA